jgi:glycine betaine/proline transport system ATP-binding protein
MSEMFAPAAEAVLPLAVTDDGGRLVGVVPRVTLLEAMAPNDTGASGDDDADPGAPDPQETTEGDPR